MPCDIHRFHRPKALTTDHHHLVPQAWQHFWVPPVYDVVRPKNFLWYPQTALVPPTCHRNVHVWIVRLMKAQAPAEDVPAIARATRKLYGWSGEAAMGLRALLTFTEAGGRLGDLRAAKLWGEA